MASTILLFLWQQLRVKFVLLRLLPQQHNLTWIYCNDEENEINISKGVRIFLTPMSALAAIFGQSRGKKNLLCT